MALDPFDVQRYGPSNYEELYKKGSKGDVSTA